MNYLTSIRGIAAFFVVLYHLKPYLEGSPVINSFALVVSKGYLAVDFFFILSGFILTYKYHEVFSRKITSSIIFDFIVRRIARIYPLHFFLMLCYLLIPLVLFILGKSINYSEYNFNGFLAKIILVDLWFIGGDFWKSWNTPSWTISGEFFAYLLFPFLCYFVGARKRLSFFSFLISIFCIAFIYEVFDSPSLGGNISTLGLFRCLFEFFCGICLFFINKNYNHIYIKNAKRYFYLTIVVTIFLLYNYQENHFFVPLLFSCLLILSLNFQNSFHDILECKILVKLGDISYSVYLSHIFILTICSKVFVVNGKFISLWYILIYLCITIIFSIMTYRYIELPSRRFVCNKILR
jgi:peptidoglycan/LPS O-acetylase OafA/YrhL